MRDVLAEHNERILASATPQGEVARRLLQEIEALGGAVCWTLKERKRIRRAVGARTHAEVRAAELVLWECHRIVWMRCLDTTRWHSRARLASCSAEQAA